MKLNKDGTTRKKGSGRTKGAVSLTTVKLSELIEVLKPEDQVVIGRKFAETVIARFKPAVVAAVPAASTTAAAEPPATDGSGIQVSVTQF